MANKLYYMSDSMLTVTISDFIRFFPLMKIHTIDNQGFLCVVRGDHTRNDSGINIAYISNILKYPFRFDGYLCLFCVKGSFKVHINLNSYDVTKNDLVILAPGNLINTSVMESENNKDLLLVMIGLSKDFISDISLDFNKIPHRSLSALDNPIFQLNEKQIAIANGLFKMSLRVMSSNYTAKKEILGCITAAAIYIAIDLLSERDKESNKEITGINPRLKSVFDRFIALVTEYHTSERGMAFYADKMCLTPKYLSKLIKQASGRSAPDWIDSFVILEAKNLLKYSGCTIKEIVFKLNFPNQSVFYKYFKAHTGITPSEYRNS